MSNEMETMMAHAPGSAAAEPLTWVLCVETTKKTERALEAVLSTPAPDASAALRTLPGTRLRLSRFTTVQTIRGFLQEQEAGRGAAATTTTTTDRRSLAHAHFFAVRMPTADSAAASGATTDAFMALPPTATLDDVLGSGAVLRCGSPDAGADAADMLVLLYMRDSEFGFDGDDILLCGLCACCFACCISLCCAADAAKDAQENTRHEQQQQQQQQHYNPPPPPQPYYQGNAPPGQPYNYGAPPQQYANGYPVAQPGYHNYSGQPEYAYQGQPAPQGPPGPYYYAQPQKQQ